MRNYRRLSILAGGLVIFASLTLTAAILYQCNSDINHNYARASTIADQINLPLVMRADQFQSNQPIWAASSTTQPHEVALFRFTFDLSEPLTNVTLKLFADTRYQVWLDGTWIGRGPARFARSYRQYDVHQLEDLAPGKHVLAVLAQWSPDNRRSESVRPLLLGALQGNLPGGNRLILRTSSEWKALLSPAWRVDAALIHQWGLIGYSELLDLNQLPADWFLPGYSDADWPLAVVVDPYLPVLTLQASSAKGTLDDERFPETDLTEPLTTIQYMPRSIPFPVNEPVPATLLDSGILLPGRAIGELPAGTPSPYNLLFQADTATLFTVETLGAGIPPASSLILLDGSPLTWESAGSLRPDVYTAQRSIDPGQHSFTFNPPVEGLTFDVSTAEVSDLSLPFEQGNHAGRRLLLAEPISQVGAVVTNLGELSSLEFTHLPAYAVLDLSRVVHGRLSAQVSGPVGTVIDIGWDERLLPGTTRPLPYPGSLHALWNQTDAWILDGTTRQLTTIDARSGRYILIAVWGSGPVRLDDLSIVSEQYPLTQSSTFQSSDPLLDQIWQIGVDTVQLNMNDAYMDPWRERGQWWGDSYVADQVNAIAFGDNDLLQRGLLFMANAFPETQAPGCAPHNNGLHMLDYAMLWVHSLSDYYRRTGDMSLLQETYPTLQGFIQHLHSFENPETGLLDLPKTTWSETAYIDTLGYHSRYGQSTALNSLYCATLLKAADIAAQVGDSANHDLWQTQAVGLQDSLNTWLYLPGEGRYNTNIYIGTPYPPTLYAQAWPLAYGLVPEGEQERVASALLELLSSDPAAPNVGTYGFYWILEGLGQSGQQEQAVNLIKSYYGRMIELGATTWWENFLADESYSTALSHAWGSSPTWFLTSYILGARQVSQAAWVLQPAFHTLEYASGSLLLPQGRLQVSWQSSGCNAEAATRITRLALEAPVGTHGQVILPHNPSLISLTVDGVEIEMVNMPTEGAIPLDSGSHLLEIGTSCAALP